MDEISKEELEAFQNGLRKGIEIGIEIGKKLAMLNEE